MPTLMNSRHLLVFPVPTLHHHDASADRETRRHFLPEDHRNHSETLLCPLCSEGTEDERRVGLVLRPGSHVWHCRLILTQACVHSAAPSCDLVCLSSQISSFMKKERCLLNDT